MIDTNEIGRTRGHTNKDIGSERTHLNYYLKKNELPNRVGKLIDKKFIGSVMATLKKSNTLNLNANKSNGYGLVIYPK